jgi:hypothetical protein
MNRKLAISVGILLALSLYIFFSGRKGPGDTPALKPWKGDATSVTLQRGDRTLSLVMEGGRWLVGPKKYPADVNLVNDLAGRIRNMEVTGLVSEQPFYEKYGLAPEKAVNVTLKNGDSVLRRLSIGDVASTGKHTYVRIDDRPQVYQISETFTLGVNLSEEDFRDREICNISGDEITEVILSYKGRISSFYKKTSEPAGAPENRKEDKAAGVWYCRELGTEPVSQPRVISIVSSFSSMMAAGFLEADPKSLGKSLASVTVRVPGKETVLSLFDYRAPEAKKGETLGQDKKYAITSSGSPYVYLIDEYRIKKYLIENTAQFRDNNENKK